MKLLMESPPEYLIKRSIEELINPKRRDLKLVITMLLIAKMLRCAEGVSRKGYNHAVRDVMAMDGTCKHINCKQYYILKALDLLTFSGTTLNMSISCLCYAEFLSGNYGSSKSEDKTRARTQDTTRDNSIS
jgi:hypothetical protein